MQIYEGQVHGTIRSAISTAEGLAFQDIFVPQVTGQTLAQHQPGYCDPDALAIVNFMTGNAVEWRRMVYDGDTYRPNATIRSPDATPFGSPKNSPKK